MPYAPYTGSPSGLVVPSTQIVTVYSAGEDRSSAFSPLQLPGLAAWYAADKITGLADGDPVVTWSDLSGNGRDATQATSSKRPTYKVAIQNGLPVVRFAVDDFLATGNFAISQPCTYILVARAPINTAAQSFYDTNSGNQLILRTNPTTGYQLYAGTLQTIGTNSGNMSVLAAYMNAASSLLYVNGLPALSPSGSIGTQGSTSGLRLGINQDGTSTPLNGDIAEFIVCNATIGQSIILRCVRYLGQKYAVSVAV